MKKETIAGFHSSITDELINETFDKEEIRIIRKISNEWLVTRIGEISIGLKSTYRYALIKPTTMFQDMFSLEREIIVIFSPYVTFEPRTLDAFDKVIRNFEALRIDKICNVLMSKDNDIEQKITELLKHNQESQIIIPISYKEFIGDNSSFFLRNKFRKHFYSRDLFAYESPLKTDLYFFGRNELVLKIADRHLSSENSGLFGLRKTGKTSIIFGIERMLEAKEERSIYIDCESTSFHMRRWNEALFYIVNLIISKYQLEFNQKPEIEYTATNAAIIFEEELLKISSCFNGKSILLIFDEIENITFEKSPSQHWESGLDFIFFWQTIRSVFHKLHKVFTFLIVGTNPMCIERPLIHGKENPIFNIAPFQYIEGFDVPQTREMVRKLGRLMGLKFDETIYAKLTEDYGGHPYLIRHICSVLNKLINSENRPVEIDRKIYKTAREEFDNKYSSYIEMLLQVLFQFYKDEYDMLQLLAIGDDEIFKGFAIESPDYTNHLLGYGIISQNGESFDFKIDAVKKYLQRKNKYKKIMLSNPEKLTEIGQRRNDIEPSLRIIVRNQLKSIHGESQAKEIVLNILGPEKKAKYMSLSYKDIFNPNKTEIYFEDLKKITSKEWDIFKNIFGKDQNDFNIKMSFLNKFGRSDAHAKIVSDEEMSYFRYCMQWLETCIKDFIE